MSRNIGIRELRQNASLYLRLVAEGEEFVVTDHNVPVAKLVPLEPGDEQVHEETWEELKERLGIVEATMSPEELLKRVPLFKLRPRKPGEPSFDELFDASREDKI